MLASGQLLSTQGHASDGIAADLPSLPNHCCI
jgi:hypothetical protein